MLIAICNSDFGISLSLDTSQIMHHVFEDSWEFMISQSECKIGRLAPFQVKHETTSTFTFTKSVLRNIEWIQQAVNHREPVLLVGETGTGKTTLV